MIAFAKNVVTAEDAKDAEVKTTLIFDIQDLEVKTVLSSASSAPSAFSVET